MPKEMKQLKQGELPFYPVTVGQAVIYEQGKTVTEKINELEQGVTASSDCMPLSEYLKDEEVIAFAFNDLNDRLDALAVDMATRLSEVYSAINTIDNRKYNKGAILDLTGSNNPNYTIDAQENMILSPTAALAVAHNEIAVILINLDENKVAPLFATSYARDESGNRIANKHAFVLLRIQEGNMSEGGRPLESQSTINWYNVFYGILVNDYSGQITQIPWTDVVPDEPGSNEPDEPYEPYEPEEPEPGDGDEPNENE